MIRNSFWRTEEGFAVKPYYRAEDLAGREYLDAARPAGVANNWQIAEQLARQSGRGRNAL